MKYLLKINLPGFPSWEQTFILKDTTEPLEITALLDKEKAWGQELSGQPIVFGDEGKSKGRILVKSSPAGARIFLDGIYTGHRTPYLITNVPAETEHVINLVKKSFRQSFKRIQLRKDQEVTINLALTKGKSGLKGRIPVRIESDPEGAEVFVNDAPLPGEKRTPISVLLSSGKSSEIEVKLPGYRIWKKTIRPVPNVDLTIIANLQK